MSIIDHKKSPNLKLSYFSGLFGCCMNGFTADYFTPYLLYLGGTAKMVGIMNALTNFFASTVQVISADLQIKFNSRKRVITLSNSLQGLTLFVIVILACVQQFSPVSLMVLVIMFATFGAFLLPPWVSMVSDLVDQNRRGTYFGWRSRNLGLITVGMTLIAGGILYIFTSVHKAWGFAVILGIALICRICSMAFVQKIQEPPATFNKADYFTFYDFIKRYKESNFVQFVLYVSAVNFSVNLAAPFFSVLMLKELKFNYFIFSLINISAPIMLYATIHRWGRHADHIGNTKIIKTVAPLISLIPILWMINQHPIYLMIVEAFSGFLWAGFNLCTTNFVMDAVIPGKRTRCLAYFTFINGLALGAGALIGGALIPYLPTLFHYKILTLFAISAMLRFSASVFLANNFKEVRTVTTTTSGRRLLLSMAGIKPLSNMPHQL